MILDHFFRGCPNDHNVLVQVWCGRPKVSEVRGAAGAGGGSSGGECGQWSSRNRSRCSERYGSVWITCGGRKSKNSGGGEEQ